MSFVLPFSLVTARVHITFGLTTFVLVGLHLASRLAYFRNRFQKAQQNRRSLVSLAVLLFAWGGLLYVSITGQEPTTSLIDQSYEAKYRSQIVRPSPLIGFLEENSQQIIRRKPQGDDELQVSMLVRFAEIVPTTSKHRSASIAVWAETTTGTMIETLYVDPEIAFSDQPEWAGAPTPRANILPIWRHRYTAVSGVDPSGEIDAITGATPSHSFSLTDYLRLGKEKEFILCAEVNAPADHNEYFTDPHIGQPSLLYTALVETDSLGKYLLLELTGHGSGAETTGAIQYDLDQITTARDLLELVLVNVSR